MKFYLTAIAFILLASCKSGAGKVAASDSANATEAIINAGGTSIDTAQNISGSQLIAANDCLTCHKVNEKSFGPSYKQIADKYELNQGNVENLADRIIKGGKGLWGQNAMTPHPSLPVPQAEKMASYILSLRTTSDTTK
ncbi:MAG: c-type cytochrome [Parafilimonas sp.]